MWLAFVVVEMLGMLLFFAWMRKSKYSTARAAEANAERVLFRVTPISGVGHVDVCSVEELEAAVGSRIGELLHVCQLSTGESEFVEVMTDGSTWYPWAQRHRIDLAYRFRSEE